MIRTATTVSSDHVLEMRDINALELAVQRALAGELGQLNRKQIAALVGVAPLA